jgi:hypothetical protein
LVEDPFDHDGVGLGLFEQGPQLDEDLSEAFLDRSLVIGLDGSRANGTERLDSTERSLDEAVTTAG